MLRSRSLRTKLALLISVLIGLISLVIYFYFPARLRDQATRSIIDESYNVTDMAAFSVGPGLLSGQRGEVFEALWTVRANTKVSYILVFDSAGQLFASFNERLAERYDFRNLPMGVRQDLPLIKQGKTVETVGGFAGGGQLFQTTAPVRHRGKTIGRIYLGFSMADLNRQITESKRTIAIVSLAVFLLGVTAAIGMSAVLTGSLSRIADTTEKIARGDLTRRAEVSEQDEVGQLAKSFNTMVDRLASAQMELAGLNAGLEKRVEERTEKLLEEIGERRRAEEALRLSEARHRHLFERNLAGVYIKRLEGEILSCNDALARMLGYRSSDEFLATGDGIAYFDPADEQTLLERLLENGSVTNYEVRLKARNGEAIWVLENISLSQSDSGGSFLEGIVLDITDRKRSEQEIEYRAYHDALTGLPNRALFKERLADSILQARRTGRSVAVMFLDLDDLKIINDTLGHTMGDQLLQRVGERLVQSLRQLDTVARVGGDEFTILLPEVQSDTAVASVAGKVVESFSQPFTIGEDEIRVSASVGVAVYPEDGDTAEALLVNSDRTMYRVKETGGNDYQFCSRVGTRTGLGRLTLEQSLRRALDLEEFVVYYQPQVNLKTAEISGAEALVRWNHPDGMVVEPAGFIALAEYTGLIVPLGEWVLGRAARQTREWSEAGFAKLRVGVNLSARQFHQRDFIGMTRRIIETNRIDPRQLEFEITESIAMQTTDWTVDMLRRLKELGLSIAMDDFGTGQTSLSHLNRFPIDTVKIDRSFVSQVGKDGQTDSPIITAVLLLCNTLGLRTVAEGVETQLQCDYLRGQNCTTMQGYFFSAPVPAEEFSKLLSAQAMARLPN